jgi:hypothetical protein
VTLDFKILKVFTPLSLSSFVFMSPSEARRSWGWPEGVDLRTYLAEGTEVPLTLRSCDLCLFSWAQRSAFAFKHFIFCISVAERSEALVRISPKGWGLTRLAERSEVPLKVLGFSQTMLMSLSACEGSISTGESWVFCAKLSSLVLPRRVPEGERSEPGGAIQHSLVILW